MDARDGYVGDLTHLLYGNFLHICFPGILHILPTAFHKTCGQLDPVCAVGDKVLILQGGWGSAPKEAPAATDDGGWKPTPNQSIYAQEVNGGG